MVLKYYYDLMSQPCRALYIFLKINKIPYEPKEIALRKGEHRQEEYTKLNPFMRVPVIDDDGFVLTESCAILKYLAAKHNVPEHWYPRQNLQTQARVDEYLNWQHFATRFQSAMLFQNLLLIPMAKNQPVNWDEVKNYRKGVKKTVSYLESYFLKDQPYLCGNVISVADLLGVCELMQLNACHEEHFYESNPVVNAWVKRVKDKLNPEFDEAHKFTYRTREVFKKIQDQLSKL